MNYFILDDIRSDDFGIHLLTDNIQHSISPNIISNTDNVLGVDGQKIFAQNYNTRSVYLECYVEDASLSDMRNFTSWINKKGVKELSLSYEQYKVYDVVIEEAITVSKLSEKGKFRINFICYNPFAHSKYSTLDIVNGVEYDEAYYMNNDDLLYVDVNSEQYQWNTITTDTNLDVYNGSNVDGAKPNIIINGSATDISIKQYSDSARTNLIAECIFGAFNGKLEINSELLNTFIDGDLDNETFEGDYIELSGVTDWEFNTAGIVASATTTTVVLDSLVSTVDDFYNGMVIAAEGERFVISDYVGATKTATIDGIFENVPSGRYGIYEVASGINYLKVTGTGLNLTDLTFDFKYIYL